MVESPCDIQGRGHGWRGASWLAGCRGEKMTAMLAEVEKGIAARVLWGRPTLGTTVQSRRVTKRTDHRDSEGVPFLQHDTAVAASNASHRIHVNLLQGSASVICLGDCCLVFVKPSCFFNRGRHVWPLRSAGSKTVGLSATSHGHIRRRNTRWTQIWYCCFIARYIKKKKEKRNWLPMYSRSLC